MNKFTITAIISILFVCCGKSKSEKTVENMKAATTNEYQANIRYTQFAQKAKQDSLYNVAAMFAAIAASEGIHAKEHSKVLSDMGISFTPVTTSVVIQSTLENLKSAKEGEDYEQNMIYPDYIKIAENDSQEKAAESLRRANVIEGKHYLYYDSAVYAIQAQDNDNEVFGTWVVCPACGDTYRGDELGDACEICSTPASAFLRFTSTNI